METRSITPAPLVWTLAVEGGVAFQISGNTGFQIWFGDTEPTVFDYGHEMVAGAVHGFTLPEGANAYVRCGATYGAPARVIVSE